MVLFKRQTMILNTIVTSLYNNQLNGTEKREQDFYVDNDYYFERIISLLMVHAPVSLFGFKDSFKKKSHTEYDWN